MYHLCRVKRSSRGEPKGNEYDNEEERDSDGNHKYINAGWFPISCLERVVG